MFCTVYILCSEGRRIPDEDALAPPHVGYLVLGVRKQLPETHAALLDAPNGSCLMKLNHARVARIRGGMRLDGLEPFGRSVRVQAWWVIPAAEPATDLQEPP